MSTHPRPWLECVELHPDVLSDDFSEDVFALDLGSLSDYLIGVEHGRPAADLPRVPTVYRDADDFFAASYLTSGLKDLLEDVLGRLVGGDGNRVLKLSTPFGGGKSHTLAALLHAARSRDALDALPEAAGLPRPERVRVAVIDGQFFDATNGKRSPDGEVAASTLWGWMAWALGGGEGYELVRAQDEARVAPGGDVLVELLRGGPSLILIDEVLEYLISAGGIRVEQTTLRDETLSFLKRLTVAVGSVEDAVLVYSLQSSKRESLEYTGLLRTVEHLAARKDQRREPVKGSEILRVIQRRLLAGDPDAGAAAATADAYAQVFTQMRRAYAHGEPERRQAEEDGSVLRDDIKVAYPFHPALIDLMRGRWAAIPDFQRTRGALRFLASCLRAAHRSGSSRPLLGPGDVPLHDQEVRLAFFKEVGQREDFQACLLHDFTGGGARARRIDDRRAREVTAEAGKHPATRLATAVLMHSFGGLRRSGGSRGELLPPGVGEPDLIGVSIGPDLDSTTIQACLKELREQCLYLHFDGVRYCFKKDPNVTLLVEQEAESVARSTGRVRARIRKMIEERLSGDKKLSEQPSAVVWPVKSADVPDRETRFLIAYLPLEFAVQPPDEQQSAALDICERSGSRQREFRNGLGLAIPDADQVEILRRAVRYLLAIEHVQAKRHEHNLTKAQRSQLKERHDTEKAAAESALVKLYSEVWLPTSGEDGIELDPVGTGGRPLLTTLDDKKRARIHQRLTELLTTVHRKVFDTVAPGRIAELFELGEPGAAQHGIPTGSVLTGFYAFLDFPRLLTAEAVRKAIARGVETGLFAYAIGRLPLGDDGRYRIDRNRIAFHRKIADDEIDLDTGFLITPAALPQEPSASPEPDTSDSNAASEPGTSEPSSGTDDQSVTQDQKADSANQATSSGGESAATAPPGVSDTREVAVAFTADRNQLFNAWNALANLADTAGKVKVSITATSDNGFDQAKIENAVLEPLRELGLLQDDA